MHRVWFAVVLSAAVGVGLIACGDKLAGLDSHSMTCMGIGPVAPAVDVKIRDAYGHPRAFGASVIVQDAKTLTPVDSERAYDSLTVSAANDFIGTANVLITKPYYLPDTIWNLVVPLGASGPCGAAPQTAELQVTLQLVPNAPAVRSVAVFGVGYTYTVGQRQQGVALVDDNPGLSTAVRWKLSDTTLAALDTTGLVTTRCSLKGGTDTLTATALADTTVKGKLAFEVGAASSCS